MDAPRAITPRLFADYLSFIDRPQNTERTYLNNLRQFAAWILKEQIDRPTRQDIISYREYLQREHAAITTDPATGWTYRTNSQGKRYTVQCKPATVAQYLRAVCQFFKWTNAAGLYPNIAENIHAPLIRNDRHKKDALQAADIAKIDNMILERIRTAKEPIKEEQETRLRAIFLLMATAGLRTVEVSRANIKDLETKNGAAYLYIWGKGHAEPDTRKPLAKEVYIAIQDYLTHRKNRRPQDPLFTATGNRSGGKRLASTTISTQIKRTLQAAGYDSERITAHSLRHTAGTYMQRITGDLYKTQMFMRHSNPATTEIYLHEETETQEAQFIQALYDLYHNTGENMKKECHIEKTPAEPKLVIVAATEEPAEPQRVEVEIVAAEEPAEPRTYKIIKAESPDTGVIRAELVKEETPDGTVYVLKKSDTEDAPEQ